MGSGEWHHRLAAGRQYGIDGHHTTTATKPYSAIQWVSWVLIDAARVPARA
jgi:hypothetical protein